MPGPVSATRISMQLPRGSLESSMEPPVSVNFTALLSKLSTILLELLGISENRSRFAGPLYE